jgi:hypothetical protein
MAASAHSGRCVNRDVSSTSVSSTTEAATMPDACVLTPIEKLTADLENEPVTGSAREREPEEDISRSG